MKRFLSMLMATVFMLTAFGVATVFSGFITAGALYDYYLYDKLPGYSVFTDEELQKMTNMFTAPGYNEVIDGVGPVVTYEFTVNDYWGWAGNEWRSFSIYNGQARNIKAASNTDHKDFKDMTWAAIDTVGNKTFLGQMGTPEYEEIVGKLLDYDGIAFWVGNNGQPYIGTVGLTLMQYPAKGPYFTMTLDDDTGDHTAQELAEYGIGFRYTATAKQADEYGYVHFDFKTDFHQADWWSEDDEGVNWWQEYNGSNIPNAPLPENVLARLSGLNITLSAGYVSVGDKVSIGDMMLYRDSRLHLDELEEVMMQYDELDPEAYTESSYEALTDIYLEAYAIMGDPYVTDNYSQRQINTVVKSMKAAIKALQPMFKVKSETVAINGFEVLTEDDIEDINDGGNVYDAAMLTDEFVPEGAATQSIYVIGGAFDGDPSYGWSRFSTSKLNDDDEVVAVNNVFGGEGLAETAGLRFWIKYGDSYTPAPTDMIVGVGSSTDGVYFECDPAAVRLPESEGYVGVAWNAFYDFEGEEDIYDYLDSLDYITVSIDGCYQKEFYLSDLHAFVWSINSADFTAMDQQIITAQDYLAGLNKNDWSVRSWQRVEEAISVARKLHNTYAITQEEVDKATELIKRALNWLTPRGDNATQEEIDALEAAYYAAKTYWRGNYTGRSYVALKAEIDEVGEYIDDELSSVACVELTNRLDTAVAGLIPIAHGGTAAPTQATDASGKPVTVKLFSVEDFSTNREFNRANGHRKSDVEYSLVTSAAGLDLPAKALKMTPKDGDLSSKYTDEHGALQFKLADFVCDPIHPDVTMADGNKVGGSIGDLKGTSGIRVWVGVNDARLARNAYFRFGVSNCQEGPLFERHAVNIPFPASGSGWIYIPWESFDYYDEWTKGQDINLTEIRFIIIRVDGEIPSGLEVYTTCVSAYTEPQNSTNATPVITGVADGDTVDVAGGSVVPKWDIGSATLTVDNDMKYYVSGTPITENGTYTLTVTNGDRQTSATFTVTGGATADAIPVVAGVTNGASYDAPVTVTWDVGEATLNGEPLEKGAVVSAPGNYMLQVVNGTKTTSVRFTINGGPAVRKGDLDEDGEITVGDALKALRIAAKLVAATDKDMLIGNVDGDDEITVGDALKILRVAAKLVDESELG